MTAKCFAEMAQSATKCCAHGFQNNVRWIPHLSTLKENEGLVVFQAVVSVIELLRHVDMNRDLSG